MTRIGVRIGLGRSRLTLAAGKLSPRVLSADAAGARIALVATGALLLGGDQVAIEVDVGPGAWLEVVEIAGTVAYDAADEPSSWSIRVRVATGGLLLWAGEPFVVATGAQVRRESRIDLAGGAIACLRDTVVLGRSREVGGSIASRTQVRLDETALLVEDLDLRDSGHRRAAGQLGPDRVIDTVSLLGAPAPPEPALPAGCRFDLAGPGTLGRWTAVELSGSPVPGWWSAWSRAAREGYLARAVEAGATAVGAGTPASVSALPVAGTG